MAMNTRFHNLTQTKKQLELQTQILSNYRAVMDKIDEIVPELAEDGGTIDGLVDYIKDKKKEINSLTLKETKTHNENVSLKSQVETITEEIDNLKHHNYTLRQDNKGYSAEEVNEYREETEGLLKEVKELKKDKGWSKARQSLINEFMERSDSWSEYYSWLEEYYPEEHKADAEALELEVGDKEKNQEWIAANHALSVEEVKEEDCCCVVMNKAGVMLYEETRKENEKLKEENGKWEADDENLTKVMSMVSKELGDDEEPWVAVDDIYDIVKKLKEQVKASSDAALEAHADYEKLVDKNNNDNLNFSDILNEREGEIVKLTKDNKALKEWVDRNQTEINQLRDVIDHPNGVKEEIIDVKDDFEWTSYIDEDILEDGTIVFYINPDKRWVVRKEIGGGYSTVVYDNGRSSSCGVSTNNNVWCDKQTGKIAILEEDPGDEDRYVELSTLFDIVKAELGRSWRPSIFAQQTSSLYGVLQGEVDRLRCVVGLAKDKVAELEEAL